MANRFDPEFPGKREPTALINSLNPNMKSEFDEY